MNFPFFTCPGNKFHLAFLAVSTPGSYHSTPGSFNIHLVLSLQVLNIYLVLFMVLTYTHLVLLLVLNHLVLLQDVYLHLDIFYTKHSHGLLTQHYIILPIFSKKHGRTSRDQYFFFKRIRPRFTRPIFLQNFTWLSKFHLPPVGIIQLIYRGVLKCYLKCNFINAKIPGYRTLIYRTLPDTMHFLLPPTCTVHRGTTVIQCTY